MSGKDRGRLITAGIADVVLLDHNLIRVVRKLHIFIDPGIPLFVATGVTRKLPGIVRIRDFADVNVQEQKVTISLGEETYLAPLLKIPGRGTGRRRSSNRIGSPS